MPRRSVSVFNAIEGILQAFLGFVFALIALWLFGIIFDKPTISFHDVLRLISAALSLVKAGIISIIKLESPI